MRNRSLPNDAKTRAITEAEELRTTGKKFKRKSPTFGKAGGAKRPYYYEYRMNRRDVDNKIQLARGGEVGQKYDFYVNGNFDEIVYSTTQLHLAKLWVLKNHKKYDTIDIWDVYGDSIHVEKSDKIQDINWLFSEEYAKGGGVGKRSLKSVAHLVDWKGEGIKKWYIRSYPTDELGEELNEDVTFKDLWDALNKKQDVYEIMGVGDSLVRERLFEYLSLIYDVDYDVVYKKWLQSAEYAKGGNIPSIKREGNYLMGYEPYFEKDVRIASVNEEDKVVRPTHGYFPNHPLAKKAIAWAKRNGYEYVADGKKYAKGGMTLQSIAEKYSENEDENAHSENVVLLAEHFGTPEELKEAKAILKKHNSEGFLSTANGAKRRDLHLKLLTKARAAMKRQGVQFAKGGEVSIPNAEKMFHLPMEVAVYVPSTSNVDKEISATEMKSRVKEVETYLAETFGGFTSSEKVGGYMSENSGIVTEKVVPVTAFATTESFSKNKSKLVNKMAVWAKKWGQEAMGLEFEGDLYYVPQKFKKGGRLTATYIPNEDIESIKTRFGQTFKGKDILDGAYVKRKVITPKLTRTQFEEEEFEFAKGGSTRQYEGLSVQDKMIADQIYHVMSLRSISEKKDVIKNSILPNLDIYNLEKNPKRIVKDNLGYALTLKSVSSMNNTLEATINALRSVHFAKGGKTPPRGMNITFTDDFFEQGRSANSMVGKFGVNNPELVNFDLDELDSFEAMQYDSFVKSMPKAEALQIIINGVEGDYSQLSEALATIAEKQEPSDMYAKGGNVETGNLKMYKLRAEGLNDFLAFLQNDMYFRIKSFTVQPIGVPDVVVSFETDASLTEIKSKLREIPDSHVMLQTVKPINEYTGDRYAKGGSVSPKGGQFMIDYCWSDVYVDDYEEGETESKGSREHDFMVGEIFDFEDLFDILESNLGLSTDPSHYTIVDNKILTSRLEDGDGEEPTKSEIESWKKGKTTLYSAHYTIGLKMVVVSELNDEMLSSITKINIE